MLLSELKSLSILFHINIFTRLGINSMPLEATPPLYLFSAINNMNMAVVRTSVVGAILVSLYIEP
jgi:hypothetical protein